MKYIKIFLILLLFPFFVLAEDTCNQDDIKIESIVLDSTSGNIEETSNPNTDNNQVNLGLKMNVIDDSITYKLVITNTSNQDYTFDKNSLSTDYINYNITYENNSDIVKAGEYKVIFLTVNYSNKPSVDKLENGVLKDNSNITFILKKEEVESTIIENVIKNNIVKKIVNPETGDSLLIYLIVLAITIFIIIFLVRYRKIRNISMLIILVLLTTNIVKAACTCTLNINANIEIDRKEAVFLPGKEVNIKMKELAGDDLSTVNNEYSFKDENITAIKYFENEPSEGNKQEKNIVSTTDSEYPIYMWYEDGTIYWWSEDETPSLNEDASFMFMYLSNLTDLSGLELLDASQMSNADNLFFYCKSLYDLTYLREWNMSKVTTIIAAFMADESLITLEGLEKWDVSSVKMFGNMFYRATSLSSIESLKDWNTSSAIDIQMMFSYCNSLISLKGLEKWDVSKVIYMNSIFSHNSVIESMDEIKNWDVSSVIYLGNAFRDCPNLKNVSFLKKWNPINVKYLNSLFEESTSLVEVDLSTWNISNVLDLSYMFDICSNLEVVDIRNFNTKNVTNFNRMFDYSPKLKHIYVGNNWNTDANTDETTYVFPSNSSLPNFSNTNTNYRDLSYAHTGEGGYLELKTND